MNKTCARCQKVVYPIEELKCLDKTWHKTCFKCTECGMALNMKTYKGFNKMPYCEAHIPKAKATAIADTPELKRIAENTKHQSNVKYHEDFEKAKGKFTQVADDPETLRIKQNTKIISNVAYHGDLEKKAAMEKQREAAESADSRAPLQQHSAQVLQQQQQHQQHHYQAAQPAGQMSPQQQHAQQYQQQYQQQQPLYHQQNTANATSTAQYMQQHAQQQQQQQQQQQHQQHYQQPQQQSQASAIKQASHLYPTAQQQLQPQQKQQQQQQQQSQPQLQQQQSQSQYQQPSNTYTQMRSAILQNSHHPTGGYTHHSNAQSASAITAVDAGISNNAAALSYSPYELQQQQQQAQPETYARPQPSLQAAAAAYQNNSSNQSLHQQQQQQQNNNSVYQQPAQAQKHLMNGGSNTSTATGNHPSLQQIYTSYTYNNGSQHSATSLASNGGAAGNNSYNMMGNGNAAVAGNAAIAASNIGKIADYDPLTDGPRNMPNTSRPSTTLIYSSDTRSAGGSNSYSKRIGSVADIDPANGIYGSLAPETNMGSHHSMQQQKQLQYYQQMQLMQQQQQQQQQPQVGSNHNSMHTVPMQQQQHSNHQLSSNTGIQLQAKQSKTNLRIYRALYDYEAQDTDEVSFREGDVIFEVDSIDSGWMTGRVERTGKTGMLPANYVEQAVI